MTKTKIIEIDQISHLDVLFLAGEEIFKHDKIWVPERKRYYDNFIQSYFRHPEIEVKALVTTRNRTISARGLALIYRNQKGPSPCNKRKGWLGFIDFKKDHIKDATKILNRLELWFISKGVYTIIGPKIDNTQAGLQVSGFNQPQTVLTNCNPDYYPQFYQNNGFVFQHKMISYLLQDDSVYKHKERKSNQISIRSFDSSHFEKDMGIIMELQKNIFSNRSTLRPEPGYYAPALNHSLTIIEAFFSHIDPDLILIAEDAVTKKTVGTVICIPDIYQLIQNGYIDRARIISIGAIPEYHKKGVGVLLSEQLKINILKKKRYKSVEASWILDSNQSAKNLLKHYHVKAGREFIIYHKSLNAASHQLFE